MNVRRDLLFLLGTWFILYVVLDSVTTFWLILNTFNGIAGERNPIGAFLFGAAGFSGMLIGKIVSFLALGLGAIALESSVEKTEGTAKGAHFGHIVNLGFSVLILIQFVVFLNNVIAILETVAALTLPFDFPANWFFFFSLLAASTVMTLTVTKTAAIMNKRGRK